MELLAPEQWFEIAVKPKDENGDIPIEKLESLALKEVYKMMYHYSEYVVRVMEAKRKAEEAKKDEKKPLIYLPK